MCSLVGCWTLPEFKKDYSSERRVVGLVEILFYFDGFVAVDLACYHLFKYYYTSNRKGEMGHVLSSFYSLFGGQLVSLQKDLVSTILVIVHLRIQLQHVFVDSVNGSSDLAGNGSDSIAVSAHVCVPRHYFCE